jgi:LysM repeat protein
MSLHRGMRFFRATLVLGLPLLLSGCGYVHFGRLPAAAMATGDGTASEAYTNLLTEHKILKQELALARKEGEALRSAMEHGGGPSPELANRLAETTRELATLRASYAKLQTERGSSGQSSAAASELEEKLAASLRNYTQLQEENGRLRADLDRTRTENSELTLQLKTSTAENQAAQASMAQLNTELLAQKEARTRAEQATNSARAQLEAVMAAKPGSAPGEGASAITSPLELAKAPPADSSAVAELRTNRDRLRGTDIATPPATAPAAKAARTHVVEAGDTLESLAQKYYGDRTRWVKIYTANNDALRDGRPLKPGTELVIPSL